MKTKLLQSKNKTDIIISDFVKDVLGSNCLEILLNDNPLLKEKVDISCRKNMRDFNCYGFVLFYLGLSEKLFYMDETNFMEEIKILEKTNDFEQGNIFLISTKYMGFFNPIHAGVCVDEKNRIVFSKRGLNNFFVESLKREELHYLYLMNSVYRLDNDSKIEFYKLKK